MKLLLAPAAEAAIRAHAEVAYPHECCGALIGAEGTVMQVVELPNTTEEGPRRRFLVRAADYQFAERQAAAAGAALLGFYHSHPDHPARPSQYDLDHAWPFFSYIIVSVRDGRAAEMSSWRLREERDGFDEEAIAAIASAQV